MGGIRVAVPTGIRVAVARITIATIIRVAAVVAYGKRRVARVTVIGVPAVVTAGVVADRARVPIVPVVVAIICVIRPDAGTETSAEKGGASQHTEDRFHGKM
jgi:hypothetical protein